MRLRPRSGDPRPDRRPRRWCAAFAAAALVAGSGSPLTAQDLPSVRTALRLAAAGRGDSARVLLNAELTRAALGSPAYIEALFWRGRLGASGDSAERDFRRVAIEYSTSRWADDALLELAQLALASGNAASAFALAQRVRGDYPGSDVGPRAALWAGRAAFATGDARTACALLDTARVEAAGNIEFVNQVEYYRGRCAALVASPPAPPPVETAMVRPAAAPAAREPPAGPSSPAFEVQVAASRSAATAQGVADRLSRAGHRARVVAGTDGLHRVRLGPFASREEAEAAAQAARRLVGGRPFLLSAP